MAPKENSGAAPYNGYPRLLIHPGEPAPASIRLSVGQRLRAYRIHVQSGHDLLRSIEEWTAKCGVDAAAFRLLSGAAQKLQIMTGGPDPEEERVATYHGPHFVECPARVLGGHGAIGSGTDGSAMHAHAVFIDSRGHARGCHVIRNRCIAAAKGIVVAIFPVQGARFCVKADGEAG